MVLFLRPSNGDLASSLPLQPVSAIVRSSSTAASGKKQAVKSKEELAQEKKKELEKRLQDVSGQLNNNKKPAKKGTLTTAPLLFLPASSFPLGCIYL